MLAPPALRTLRQRLQPWARRRSNDPSPLQIQRRRLYILPSRQGLVFAALLLTMLLGSMNYDNAMGYLLTFLLAGMGIVSMHHAHRNLLGLQIQPLGASPVFAGASACFRIRLHNPSRLDRFEVRLTLGTHHSVTVDIPAGDSRVVGIDIPTHRRGELVFEHMRIDSGHPGHLLHVWSRAWLRQATVVWPTPAVLAPPPPASTATAEPRAALQERSGDDDFAGLREFHAGDPPRRIAWKAFARDRQLKIKQFSGAAAAPLWLELNATPDGDLDTRLAIMSRWVIDAHRTGHAFGVRLPGAELPPGSGMRHRERALTLLACFDRPRSHGDL